MYLDRKWKPNGITIAGGNQFKRPQSLFIDTNQYIYIIDTYNHRIIQWDIDTKTSRIVAGGNGSGKQINQLNYPTNVIINKEKNLLIIADGQNRRIIQWSLEKNTINGEILLSDIDCHGVAMDKDGLIYISDSKKNEVSCWRSGEKERTIIAGGNGQGDNLNQLDSPSYIFIDDDYSLYVSDEKNHRVMKWGKDAEEGIIIAGGNGEGDSLNQLSQLGGIVVDQFHQVYVADCGNDRIMCWCEGVEEGSVVIGGNREGKEANQFSGPMDLSFDQQGNLYVVDQWNHRIQKFEIDMD